VVFQEWIKKATRLSHPSGVDYLSFVGL